MSIKSNFSFIGILLVTAGILVASNIYTLIPLYSSIGNSFSSNEQALSFASFIFTFCYAFGLLCFGPISDKIGKKTVMTWGMLFASISTFFIYVSSNLFELYLFRGLQGFALASFAPVAFSYSFDLYTPRARTFWLALINSGFLAAGIIGQLISSVINSYFSWFEVFLFFCVCYLMLFICFLSYLPNTKNTNVHSKENVLVIMYKLLTDQLLRKCYLIVFTILFSFVAFYDAMTSLELSPSELFFIRSVGLIGVILSIYTGKLIKKFSYLKTLIIGILLALISVCSLMILTSTIWMAIFSIMFVSSISLLIPTLITLIGDFSEKNKGKALSLYSFILLLGASLSSIIANFFSYTTVLLILLIFFIINLILSYKIHKDLNKGSVMSIRPTFNKSQ